MKGLLPEAMARNVTKADNLLIHSKSKRLEALRVSVVSGAYGVSKEELAERLLQSMMRPADRVLLPARKYKGALLSKNVHRVGPLG